MIDPQRNKEEAEPLARIKNNIAAHSDVFLTITHHTDMGSFFIPSVFFVFGAIILIICIGCLI